MSLRERSVGAAQFGVRTVEVAIGGTSKELLMELQDRRCICHADEDLKGSGKKVTKVGPKQEGTEEDFLASP